MEKEVFPAFGRFRDGILFMAVTVVVVGRVAGDESSLKGSQSLANMDEGIRAQVAREGSGKEAPVSGICSNYLEEPIVLR